MSTDHAWVEWGRHDPYYAVITDPKFRRHALTDDARRLFFDSGSHHIEWVLERCRRIVDPGFKPSRAIDFGCGVGRVAIPLARQVQSVVGVDVSPAMLEEAGRNATAMGVDNVSWVASDDQLSRVEGRFDLVHSCIVFQHIDVDRGRALFARLVDLLSPGGVAAIQITYAKAQYEANFGQPPAPEGTKGRAGGVLKVITRRFGGDPDMQMNAYALGELAFLLQRRGVPSFHAEFTDHGGELGVFLFFARPAA
jgi:SAM-dependent methyltransferase